ncbi:dexamethasone-induced Ras-related protein 1 isoform X2 [Pithys albifrons albifrons]|uniref:dexamethasone-induced Ras-related protein 1 isoform X2 n=1 Tax=Pithys albifrons albifrons TaxID=3385563 RepID=UPI003A5CF38C
MKLAAMIKKMCPSEAELSIPAKNCYRMVILGSSKVGKTAIVSRFLTGRFEEQYTPTIEDFHRKFYSIRGEVYQLDILDTSGNHPFPAMRRLSILTANPGDQVVPEEQDQGEHRGALGHLRQQGRPGLLPGGGTPGDRAAGGRGPQKMRLLRDLSQEEQQPGPDVPGTLRHGQAAQRDEPRPAPQSLSPVLRHPAQEGSERQKAAEGGRPGQHGGGVRHRGPLRPATQRPQRPHVHPGESHRRRAGQGEGSLCDQLGSPAPIRKEGRKERRKGGGKGACFRTEFGQAEGWAGTYPGREGVASPPASLLPLSSPLSPGGAFWERVMRRGRLRRAEGGCHWEQPPPLGRETGKGELLLARWEKVCAGHRPWYFFFSQTTQPQALFSGGQGRACQQLTGALGLVFGVFFST